MISPLDTETEPEALPAKPRRRGRRQALTVASVLLAVLGGVVAGSGTASAQTVPGACSALCNQRPSWVAEADWDAGVEAANWWANNNIDQTQVVWSGIRSYYRITSSHFGWPGQRQGGHWFGFREGSHDQFVYYGGVYNDWNGMISNIEHARGVSGSRAYSSAGHTTAPYVEYDISYYGQPNSQRNALRLVRNPNSGNVYLTTDHYQTFTFLGHF
ncbi:hypothetical protein HLK59_26170 [Streptomyces sp. S3(2020)]|uniref:ribonuclease domain-containing protein n=1 Tax=Streptomyces sp. S3(2020) TaxID=2732044 RepID=UPI00148A08D7|nr:ribonuclease domain-containing protein [Streptomyces sp. S3(2020)]NNN33788.1 hypothetical protein [Streptomyces sp. S3(2020)]